MSIVTDNKIITKVSIINPSKLSSNQIPEESNDFSNQFGPMEKRLLTESSSYFKNLVMIPD